MSSRNLARVLPAAVCVLCAFNAHAQSYPLRPVRLIVAFAPGGSTDLVARLIAQKLGERLQKSVVVDNRAGGNTTIGTELAARATPDGHTLLFGTPATVIVPLLSKAATYDAVRDFAPVSLVSVSPNGLLVHPGVAAHTVKELIALAKGRPGKINFASSGSGSGQHLSGELFKSMAGIDIVHIPYKGAGPALIDLIAGRVDFMITSLIGNVDHVNTGRLRILATTGAKRTAAMPQVPTMIEAGVAGFDVSVWQAFFAPVHTPRAIIDILNAHLGVIARSREVLERTSAQGIELQAGTPDELGAMVHAEVARWSKVIRETGTRVE